LPQIVGVEQVFAGLAVGKGQVEAAVAGDLVFRQQRGARGAEDEAIVLRQPRQQPDHLRQPLVERVVDPGQHIAAQVPQRVDQAIDRETGSHHHAGRRQQRNQKQAQPPSCPRHRRPTVKPQ
jgi:hypothetical protein